MGMAIIFESEILKEDMDILGFPRLRIKLASDKPKAMLFAQLSECREDGFVQRVSYGVLNLALSEDKSRFVPLRADEFIERELRLDACGHRFARGSKIRLSLANTFFPMFWPMPYRSTLKVDLSCSEFILPLFKGEDSAVNLQPQSAPKTPLTLLKKGRVDRKISYDILSDTWTCVTDGVGGVFGEGVYRFDAVDVLVWHNLKRKLSIKNDDP